MKITGAALFTKALKAEGVDMRFGYPGGQAIDLFDALYDHPSIEVILPRHEQGLAHAADGYALSLIHICTMNTRGRMNMSRNPAFIFLR